jgi:hypothetical protein
MREGWKFPVVSHASTGSQMQAAATKAAMARAETIS